MAFSVGTALFRNAGKALRQGPATQAQGVLLKSTVMNLLRSVFAAMKDNLSVRSPPCLFATPLLMRAWLERSPTRASRAVLRTPRSSATFSTAWERAGRRSQRRLCRISSGSSPRRRD